MQGLCVGVGRVVVIPHCTRREPAAHGRGGLGALSSPHIPGAAYTDLPVLEKAFADSPGYHTTQAAKRPVEVQVSDAAVAAALRLAGQDPADFGFPLLEMYKVRGPQALQLASINIHGLIGFFDDTACQAAHQRTTEWLDKHRKQKPRQQP